MFPWKSGKNTTSARKENLKSYEHLKCEYEAREHNACTSSTLYLYNWINIVNKILPVTYYKLSELIKFSGVAQTILITKQIKFYK